MYATPYEKEETVDYKKLRSDTKHEETCLKNRLKRKNKKKH
jgi:hypothetical protein